MSQNRLSFVAVTAVVKYIFLFFLSANYFAVCCQSVWHRAIELGFKNLRGFSRSLKNPENLNSPISVLYFYTV